MATIKDVSKVSGLSVGTVSRYLNGTPLKEQNRKKIEEAIQKLDYNRNSLARSMKTGKSMTVAVVVPNLANMFSMRVIESIERVLEQHDYSVLVADCSSDEAKQFEKLYLLKNKMVDGFVLMPSSTGAEKVQAAVGTTPLVLIDRLLDAPVFDSVIIDNREIAYRKVKQALDGGVTRIGIIEGPDWIYTTHERRLGYEQALREAGIANRFSAQGGFTYAGGYKAMQELLTYDLEAVFISNFELTVGAVQAYNSSSQKLQLIGFSSLELSTVVAHPITFISQPVEEIGKQAAQLLLQRMDKPEKPIENLILNL